MILGMPDGTSFYVYDSNNRVRLRIDVRDAASGVSLHGKSADKRALFGTLQDEAMILLHGEGEQLVVLDAQGLRREPQE